MLNTRYRLLLTKLVPAPPDGWKFDLGKTL